MKIKTKRSVHTTFSRGLFLSLFTLLFSACASSPTEFTIDGPYTVYNSSVKADVTPAKSKDEMQKYAYDVCQQHRFSKLKRDDMPPTPFTSDGCSKSPDGNWVSCCMEHDISYWCGGTKQDRLDADNKLQQCIAHKGHPIYGWVANKLGVQVGGSPLWPTSFRWGYGWPYPYEYNAEK